MVIPALVAWAWLAIPGFAVATGLRLKADVALLFAPLLSLAIIAASAILAPFLHLSWGPIPPLLLTLVLAGAAWGARWWRSRRRPPHSAAGRTRPKKTWAQALTTVPALTIVSLLLAAVVMTVVGVRILGSPLAFSQTYDAVFHLNALRWILDTGNASSFSLTRMIYSEARTSFYPAAWHDLASLILTTVGRDDVRLGTNAAILVTITYVWPASVLAFVRAWAPGPIVRFSLVPAAVVLAVVPSFPYRFVGFGVLYPNLLGYALVPAFLALFGAFLGLRRRLGLSWPALVVLLALGAPAVAIAHPSAAMGVIVASIALTAGYAFGPGARRRWYLVPVYLAGAGALYGVAAIAWPLLRPAGNAANTWPPLMNVAEAVGQAVLASPFTSTPRWGLMILLILAVGMSVRYREYGPLLLWGAFAFMWVVAAGWPDSPGRTAIVGPWYSDVQRMAALLALAMVPLAALGAGYALARVYSLCTAALRGRVSVPLRRVSVAAVSAALIAAFALITFTSTRMEEFRQWTAAHYRVGDGANVISARELALINEIPNLVEPDSTIYVNPWHGEALIYGLTGINTTSKHQQGFNPPAERYLDGRLNRIDDDPQVCASLKELDADYVAVFFGPVINNDVRQFNAPGLDGLTRVDGLTLVAHDGGAYLYRVTGCG